MNTTDVPPIREKHSRIEGEYMVPEHTPHGSQYFVMGNNKIMIKEHFMNDGNSLESILKKVILDAGNSQKTA